MSEILYPEDEAALAAALREARGALQIMGGGTRQIGRIAPAQALSTRRVQGISLYEPGAMTLVAKTGKMRIQLYIPIHQTFLKKLMVNLE